MMFSQGLKGISTWIDARPRASMLLFCVLLFMGCLQLYNVNNDFPSRYHPDEPGKIRQMQTGEFNFKHPQLMLTTTRLWMRLNDMPEDTESIARAGREVSAFFAALGVLSLSLAAWRLHGLGAAACVGLTVGLGHALLVYAHFMKEDATVTGVFCIWLLALSLFWRAPEKTWPSVVLGLSTGLFVAGKYIGVVGIPVSVLAALLHPRQGRWKRNARRAGLVFLFCLAGFVLANISLVPQFTSFVSGLRFETEHILTGHYGHYTSLPNLRCLSEIWKEIPLPVWIPAMFHLWRVVMQWRDREGFERFMLFAPLIVLAPLWFSRIYSTRYILPATVAVYYLAGMGLWELITAPPELLGRYGKRTGLALLALVIALHGYQDAKLLYLFANNARSNLEQWVVAHVPPHAVVLQDKYAALPVTPEERRRSKMPQELVSERFAGSVGSVESARQKGVTHVAVCNRSYDRFFRDEPVLPQYQKEYEQMRNFYNELFTKGKLLWACKRRPGFQYMNIELRLYAIDPATPGRETEYCPCDVSER